MPHLSFIALKNIINEVSSLIQSTGSPSPQSLHAIFYELSYPFELEKFQNLNNLFNLLLAIIVDSGQHNVHIDSEMVCCKITTIEQWYNSYRVQTSCASNEAHFLL